MEDSIHRAKKALSKADRVAVLTGAGISAESGVPTFRGKDGLWRKFRAEELATPGAFARDPKLIWEWYDWRRGIVAKAKPNAGHKALAELERRSEDFWLITQNVDGLHRQAGSKKVLCLHGDIWRTRCTACGKYTEDRRTPLPELPPKCTECAGVLRPDIVWFGEALPAGTIDQAFLASKEAEVFLVVGTSGMVEPAASLARLAKNAGAFVIEINLEPTPLTPFADSTLHGKAGEILPKLIDSAAAD
ncbi:MAG: NAD-dependent deacylase [Elusimicrobiota bacterium]